MRGNVGWMFDVLMLSDYIVDFMVLFILYEVVFGSKVMLILVNLIFIILCYGFVKLNFI